MMHLSNNNLNISLKEITMIFGALLAFILLLFGLSNLINPDVPENYLEQNTRVCWMMIIAGLVTAYAIFRPFSGGILMCICAVGLGFVFKGFFRNPLTPVVLLSGALFIISSYPTPRRLPDDSEQQPPD